MGSGEEDDQLQKPAQPAPAPATGIPAAPPEYMGIQAPDQAPVPLEFGAGDSGRYGEWSTGLCDCLDDGRICCVTIFCPCITFGQISEIVDRGSTSCAFNGLLYVLITYIFGCPCLYSCFYRTKLRKLYELDENPCHDCLVHCFCEQCSLCQEYRELKHRGFDMSLDTTVG